MSNELETVQFWTQAEGEDEQVRTFARIPQGWEGKLDQHPQDNEIFYWCNEQEWIGLGSGEQYGDVELLRCACEECESERFAEYWVEQLS